MKLEEGRKRDTAANALLALSFAASAAQSPKDLIRSGNIEGPGIQLMSRMMNKRKKATASGLDNPRVSEPARNRKKKTFEEFIVEAKKCWPGYKKKGTKKLFGKTYNNCVKEEFELEESSGDERMPRGSTGRRTGRALNQMKRDEKSTAAIATKAGLKGTGKLSTKDLRTPARDYTTYDSDDDLDDIGSTEQDHFIRTYSSARKAAKGERLISKLKPAGKTPSGMTKLKTAPSSESVRKVKDMKKQMTKTGATKTGKVHTVDIMPRDGEFGKGDRAKQIERGKNFIQAIQDTPKQLKIASAKPGETVIGKPTAVMSGEDKKTGEAKRAKLYKKIFGKRSTEKSEKTGVMLGKAG